MSNTSPGRTLVSWPGQAEFRVDCWPPETPDAPARQSRRPAPRQAHPGTCWPLPQASPADEVEDEEPIWRRYVDDRLRHFDDGSLR